MRDLLVICPTLWRRTKVQQMLESWDATPRGMLTDLALIVDNGDPSYDGIIPPKDARFWVPLSADISTTAEKTNAAALAACNDYRAIMSTGDDAHFMTPKWDQLLMRPLEDRPGMTYPDMDGREVTVPGICVISSPIIKALGWMFMPQLHHYWADNVWRDLGQAAGCLTFVREAVMHDAYGPHDPTYARAQQWGGEDHVKYQQWREQAFETDVATVQEAIAKAGTGGDWSC